MMDQAHDFLDEDFVKVGGQNYALVSFVSKDSRQKAEGDKIGVKIRGVFATKEEAEAHIKKLMKFDNSFDVYLVDMYKWLLVPPNNDDIEDHRYQEQYLNDMVQGYKESQLLAKQQFEERKRLIMERGLDATLTPEERVPAPKEPLPAAEKWLPEKEGEASGSGGSSNI